MPDWDKLQNFAEHAACCYADNARVCVDKKFPDYPPEAKATIVAAMIKAAADEFRTAAFVHLAERFFEKQEPALGRFDESEDGEDGTEDAE